MNFSQIDEDASGLTLKDTVTLSGDVNITGTLGLFGVTAVAQQETTGTTTGFTAGSGTTVVSGSTFTGNFGTAAYTISDAILALKKIGLLAKDA